MFQRVIVSCVVLLSATVAQVHAQSCILDLPSEVLGVPGDGASWGGTLTLGASGSYYFKVKGFGTTSKLSVGSGLVRPNAVFTYAGTPVAFGISDFWPAGSCPAPSNVDIEVFNIAQQRVCKRQLTLRCVYPKAILRPKDPMHANFVYCGANQAVRIDGSASVTASTYAIEVIRFKDAARVSKTLSFAEAKDIGDFDLRRITGNDFFKPGNKYSVTLKTVPGDARDATEITFPEAEPRFRMRDRSGKLRLSDDPGRGDAKEPITVCPGKMVVDASPTSCETAYNVIVQESDASWNRTNTHEFGRWFNVQAPDEINLDELIRRYPESASPVKKSFELASGGTVFRPSPPRYFRIGLATGEPEWDTTWLLVRTGTELECSPPIDVKLTTTNPCPRTDNIPFSQITAELTRLFFSPCRFSLNQCPFGQPEREVVPLPVGTKRHQVAAWQGMLSGNPLTVDLETQDQMLAGMRRVAAAMAPPCSNGEKKVPVEIELETDAPNTTTPQYRVLMNVTYACCAKSPF